MSSQQPKYRKQRNIRRHHVVCVAVVVAVAIADADALALAALVAALAAALAALAAAPAFFFVGELGTTYLETRLANGEASHNLHHRTPELWHCASTE